MFKKIIFPINKTNMLIKIAKKSIQLAKEFGIRLTAIYTIKLTVFTVAMLIHQEYALKHHSDIQEGKKEKAYDF